MVYTVTFNPSLDYILDVPNLVDGEVNRTTAERIMPGGKGVNVSMVLDNLGIDNRAICFIAGFTGDAFKQLAYKRKMNADFIEIDEGTTRINVKIRGNKETEINGQGPAIEQQYISQLYEKLGYLDEEDYLVLAGSLPDAMGNMVYKDIAQMMEYTKCKVVVDATGDLLTNALEHKPFLVKPNINELGKLFDTEIKNKEEAFTYAAKLHQMGARNVIVSMASEGAIMLTEDGDRYEMEAPKGIVKNSVGAGDSMMAGFLAGYIKEADYEKAFKLGVYTGSASAFSEEMATKIEVESLMASNQ